MIDSNRIEVDIKHIEKLVSDYIQLNFSPNYTEEIHSSHVAHKMRPLLGVGVIGRLNIDNADSFNFIELFKKNGDESFSKMRYSDGARSSTRRKLSV